MLEGLGKLFTTTMFSSTRASVGGGGEAEELRDVVTTFPISQDQRNSVSAQFRFEPQPRIWFALGGRCGSGLPVSPRLERYSYFAPESS